jgi:hypothetical protein
MEGRDENLEGQEINKSNELNETDSDTMHKTLRFPYGKTRFFAMIFARRLREFLQLRPDWVRDQARDQIRERRHAIG